MSSGDLSRRHVLGAAIALPAGIMLAEEVCAQSSAGTGLAKSNDGYFLSASNPIANVDQRDIDALAIAIFNRPDVRAARERASATWAAVTDRLYSPEQWQRFPDHVSDYSFASTLVAVNSDGNYPRIVRAFSPGGRWLGNDVPASKWGGDNPDNAYRLIPVDADGQYELHGQRQANPPANVSYQLIGSIASGLTFASIEQRNMDIAPDGSFVLTLDSSPANGRRNHLQISPGARHINVRDTMSDWRQSPDALRIRRLNPPTRARLGEDELAARAIQEIRSNVYFMYYALRFYFNGPAQKMSNPQPITSTSALPTQTSSSGYVRLAPDEAAILTATAPDALYRSVVLHDLWNRSLEYRDHQSHLNKSQMALDADGRITFVVSREDPGIANWLDSQGSAELLIGHRWQGLPPNASQAPRLDCTIVKFSELGGALPRGVKSITAAERTAQLRQRQETYDRRFNDR